MMRMIRSDEGQEEAVTVRRSESSDARGIERLISPSSEAVFGHVSAITLLEKANLAVTLTNESEDVLAHASFFDFPSGDFMDGAQWEPFLHTHFTAERCTPVNTLFLHLFVAQPEFATASIKEIIRDTFHAVSELDFICLISTNSSAALEPALDQILKPLQRRTHSETQCCAFMCERTDQCEQLSVRRARVEDHDEVMLLFIDENTLLSTFNHHDFLLDTIQDQDEGNHAAVCETNQAIVGFMSISISIDVKMLQENYDLSQFEGFHTKPDQNVEDGSSSTQQQQQQQQSEAAGTANAFCVQLFLIDKNYENRSVDFLPYVFQQFPELNFCVVSVPSQTQEPVLLHDFVMVPQRESSTLNQDLYMFHRDALQGVTVRPAVRSDGDTVAALVQDLSLKEFLLQDLQRFYDSHSDTDGVPLQAFVAQVSGEVVGVVIIRDQQDIEYLRSHFNIENFIYFSHHGYDEHAQLLHFTFKPSLLHLSRHTLKEVLRLAHKSCLYLRRYQDLSQENFCLHHLDFVYERAVPVRPRPQIIYPLEELDINVPSTQVTQEKASFALSLISRKLTLEPKITVTTRIVMVGASDTGLSFLETLCFCPHLRFKHLTLVSTHGLHGKHSHEYCEFLTTSHAYSSTDLVHIPFHSCVRVVEGKMVAINRKYKHIRVSNGEKISYDFLVLCTGLQYRKPSLKTEEPKQPMRTIRSTFSNVLTINDLHDCRAAHQWLSENFVKQGGKAIIYGEGVDVLSSLQVLLSLGVSGSRIHLVLPGPSSSSWFPDPVLDKAVQSAMDGAQVQVHLLSDLDQMDHDQASQRLTSVTLTTGGEPLHLECGVFINLSNRGVDYDAFRAITESFLLFDHRLVINSRFLTNDPSIYAAGPLTRFSRLCGSVGRSHADYCSTEVGRDLATTLLSHFDPTLEQQAGAEPDVNARLLKYTQAKIQGGKLPGGFTFLHVTKPCEKHWTENTDKPQVVTGRADRGNYFCLTFDPYDTVQTITCLSLKPLPLCNYLSLYGKHRALLGLHDQGSVHDLYSFFRQKHFLPLFHDRFSDLEQELQLITQLKEAEGPSHSSLSEESCAAVRSITVNFLSYNKNLLPVFATPDQLINRNILQ
ncbi:cilia- and flagella-associated protein 61 isoform X3 [Gouania willdenowi]|uniref:cilia- and flagella-associated protein 61 isoform X3 n=1 Tax=Gouania willdenowi TaxID=441366 RepID=UPI0010561784|nr:cilia- and flagella-associated protein 61 isoform X3 [Gouania willdenowi]